MIAAAAVTLALNVTCSQPISQAIKCEFMPELKGKFDKSSDPQTAWWTKEIA
jgi:hypothetical protein